MLSIQLTPRLHHIVHNLKTIDSRDTVSPFLDNLPLSVAELHGTINIFSQSTQSRIKDLKVSGREWY